MANAREEMLQKIRQNRPQSDSIEYDLGQWIEKERASDLMLEDFISRLKDAGGEAIELDRQKINAVISDRYPDAKKILSFLDSDQIGAERVEDLAQTDVSIVEGQFGVAENGAVWIAMAPQIPQALPFIATHLVIVLEREKIVETMHHAYERVDLRQRGFGVFICGPSKTADIEQSLVIGAHGAKSLLVILV